LSFARRTSVADGTYRVGEWVDRLLLLNEWPGCWVGAIGLVGFQSVRFGP